MKTTLPIPQNFTEQLSWDSQGLIPVITQDANTGTVLMLAWMNKEALQETLRTGQATYWSRSRKKLWRKGEESGHTQAVKAIRTDCDSDALLLWVTPLGGITCHTGRESCFFLEWQDEAWRAVTPVLRDPKEIYHAS